MKPLAVLIPNDKDLEDFLTSTSDKYDVEYLKYLIHYVIIGLSKIIDHPYPDKNGVYTQLDKRYIGLNIKEDVIIGDSKHKKHIDLLRSDEIDKFKRGSRTTKIYEKVPVLYRRNYKKGELSFGYRLNPRFFYRPLKIHIINDYKLTNLIKNKHSKTTPIVNSGTYKFLNKFFNPAKLKIDLDKAIELCELRWSEHKKYGKYLNEMVQIIDLFNGTYQIYYKDDTDARIHTNLTRLPKVYRKFITYNNSALVEVDLSNSIVFFLSMLLSNKLDSKLINNTPLLLMFANSLLPLENREIEQMQVEAVDGTFYDDFIPEYQKEYIYDDIKEMYEKVNDDKFIGTEKQIRKVVKKRILAMIFAETNDRKKRTDRKIFKIKYPNILKVINNFKDEFGYKKLSHLLFQLEAHFMINEAGRSFNAKHWRKAPLFTLHDCLITSIEYGDELEKVMKSVFIELIGISPMMKRKEWV